MLVAQSAFQQPGGICQAPDTAVVASRLGAAWASGAMQLMGVVWMAMVLAMVPPLAMPAVRHVTARSLPQRRRRAAAGFLAAAAAPWLIFGVGAVVLAVIVDGARWPMVAGFLVAALWQLTPVKRDMLRLCHRSVALAATGWAADRDCLAFGWTQGLACLGSCWAMMLAPMLAHDSLPAMLAVQIIAISERWTSRPEIVRSALLLTGGAGLAIIA